MDPSAPVQIAAWIVAGLLALFSLGGCAPGEIGANIDAFNAVYQPMSFRPAPRPVVNCITYDNYNGSRTVCQ